MAVEGVRGCGYRLVGGLYLVGSRYWSTCDRLKLEIPVCPCCGETPRPNRGMQPINAHKMFGEHRDIEECDDRRMCRICYPADTRHRSHKDYLIWVGREHYSEEEFSAEAELVGISRRIPHVPDGLSIGRSVIYLAMRGNINRIIGASGDGSRAITANGIFMAFAPERLELLIWESEVNDLYIENLAERNITAIIIPDGDEDHKPSRVRKGRVHVHPDVLNMTSIDLMDGL